VNLRTAYHEHQRDSREQLVRARAGLVRKDGSFDHRTRLPISEVVGEIDARKLSDRQIERLALRDAEFTMNIAQHQHNEEIDRNARR
jgi:hypothetical protein